MSKWRVHKLEVLVSIRYGGFSFSTEAKKYLCKKYNINYDSYVEVTNGSWKDIFSPRDNPSIRTEPYAIDCVKELGKKANGSFGDIRIAEIPKDSEYAIYKDDSGVETLYYSKAPIHEYKWD